MDGRLFVGDCRAVLPTLPPETVQLVCTSPPYNTGMRYGDDGSGDRLPLPDYQAMLEEALAACRRILRPGGVLALNLPPSIAIRGEDGEIAERAYPIGAWAQLHLLGSGWLLDPPVTWVKVGGQGTPLAAGGVRGAPRDFRLRPTHELLVLAHKATYRLEHKHPTDWGFRGYPEALKDTWPLPPGKKGPGGALAFPPELVERALNLFTMPGDTVLDPFAGNGTVGRVALEMGRRVWLIEREPTYRPRLEAALGHEGPAGVGPHTVRARRAGALPLGRDRGGAVPLKRRPSSKEAL